MRANGEVNYYARLLSEFSAIHLALKLRTPFSFASITSSEQATLKERLRHGEQLYGAFSLSFSPVVAEILGWGGYDFVVVDMEHGPGDTMAALPILQVLASTNTPAIVRVPVNDPTWAKKALDMGPAGIMFPMVNDAEVARRAVESCRYPPNGIRGAAYSIARAARYGMDASYLNKCEDDLLIMCQVESQEAINNITQIAAVDGVDCIQMGPRDLRSDMGLLRVPNDKSPVEVLRKAEKVAKSSGVYLSGVANADDPPSKLLGLGYNMVLGAVDVALLRDAVQSDVRNAKGKFPLEQEPTQGYTRLFFISYRIMHCFPRKESLMIHFLLICKECEYK